ncbi:MAG: MFS transporter [Leptospirales bacterium]|jgi:MFS family permease
MTRRPPYVLPAIVFSQFAGTSLWFAGNAVLADLRLPGAADEAGIQRITQAVQLGFIVGTLVFALFAVADRRSPRLVFLLCSLAGAAANLAGAHLARDVTSLMALRFCTGFFLAGIYPVGMKVAAGWYERGLGSALGYLVGALVLGTAFPHLLQALGETGFFVVEVRGGPERARSVLSFVSALAGLGGCALYFLVPDGPYLPRVPYRGETPVNTLSKNIRKTRVPRAATKPWEGALVTDPDAKPGKDSAGSFAIVSVFQNARFRRAALGYFGHMWELYAFWAFTPIFLTALFEKHAVKSEASVSLWSFLIIAVGFFGCALGGYASLRAGSARVALAQLAVSGGLCLLSPLLFLDIVPLWIALACMLLWGVTVIGDSPQFSALVAANAPRQLVGSALTVVNSIGFSLTIVSIEVVGSWARCVSDPAWLFIMLAPGPLAGLLAMRGFLRDSG